MLEAAVLLCAAIQLPAQQADVGQKPSDGEPSSHFIPAEDNQSEECAKIFKATKGKAEKGDARDQWALGADYYDGQGVAQDYAEAVKWFRKAAEQNYAEAEANLGFCYDNGQGVAQDYVEAVKWYRKAAEQNYVSAQFALGSCYATGPISDP